MNKIHLKLIFIIFLSIMFVFIFPSKKIYGYTNHTEDDGPDVSDTRYKWHFTYYSDGNGGLGHTNPNTGNSFSQDDFEVNETYGWHEWTYNGTKYVVMAAATLEGIDELPNANYPFIDKQSNIHYFHYGTAANNWNYSTFKFRFVDNGDTNEYNGIVLDTCELALDPSDPSWDELGYGAKPENTEWLDVHVPLGYPEKDKYDKFNGKEIVLTSTGVFSQRTAEKANGENTRKWWCDFISGLFIKGADSLQRLMDSTVTGDDCRDLTYSATEIENGKSQGTDNKSEEINKDLIEAISLRGSTEK